MRGGACSYTRIRDLFALQYVTQPASIDQRDVPGRDPFEILHAHAEEVLPLPSAVSPAASVIVERALQKRPGDCFASATALVHTLEAALA